MKTFNIPVTWEMYGSIEIEAETLEEAIDKFDKFEDEIGHDLPEAKEAEYTDDSFKRGDLASCKGNNK